MAAVSIISTEGLVQLSGSGSANPFVYVVDSGNSRINAYTQEGTFRFSFGSEGSGDGEFIRPYGIATDDEFLYVTDTGNARVQKFTMRGEYVSQWGSVGQGDGELNEPLGIYVDEIFVYVVDSNNNRFQMFFKDGTHYATVGGPDAGSGLYQFDHPTDISGDLAYLYIVDDGNSRVVTMAKAPYVPEPAEIPNLEVEELTGYNNNAPIDAYLPRIEPELYAEIYGAVVDIDAEIPEMEVEEMYGGMYLDSELPTIESEIDLMVGRIGEIDAEFLSLESEIVGDVSIVGTIDAVLPRLFAEADIMAVGEGTVDADLPLITSQIFGWSGSTIFIDSVLPIMVGELEVIESITGTIDAEIGPLFAEILSVLTNPSYTMDAVLVMNTKTSALSTYDTFDFNSMCGALGVTLAAGADGIYLLEGSRDRVIGNVGSPIAATMKTKTFDFHDTLVQKIREAYLVYRSGGELKVTVEGDEQTQYDYYAPSAHDSMREERVKFGRGLNHEKYAFILENSEGEDFTLDSFRVKDEALPHRKR